MNNNKQYEITVALAYFLGIFGVHRFYNKQFISGLIMFFTFGLFGIWYIVDVFFLISKRYKINNEILTYEGNFFDLFIHKVIVFLLLLSIIFNVIRIII